MKQKIIDTALEKGIYYKNGRGSVVYIEGKDLSYSKYDGLLQYTYYGEADTWLLENIFVEQNYQKEWAIDKKDLQDDFNTPQNLQLQNIGYSIDWVSDTLIEYKRNTLWGEYRLTVNKQYDAIAFHSLIRGFNGEEEIESMLDDMRQEKKEIIELLKEIKKWLRLYGKRYRK